MRRRAVLRVLLMTRVELLALKPGDRVRYIPIPAMVATVVQVAPQWVRIRYDESCAKWISGCLDSAILAHEANQWRKV